jgi:hypothetical protein
VGDNIQVVLNCLPDELETDRIDHTCYALLAGKVTVEVLPLYISCAKRYKDWQGILREEAGLGSQAITLILPEQARPC